MEYHAYFAPDEASCSTLQAALEFFCQFYDVINNKYLSS